MVRAYDQIIHIGGIRQRLAHFLAGDRLSLHIEADVIHRYGVKGFYLIVAVRAELGQIVARRAHHQVDVAVLELHQAGGIIRHDGHLDLLSNSLGRVVVIGILFEQHVLVFHPVGNIIRAAGDEVLIVAALAAVLLDNGAAGHCEIGQEVRRRGLQRHNDRRVVGAFNARDGRQKAREDGFFRVDGTVERIQDILCRNSVAIVEFQPVAQMEGVRQAVLGNVPALGQSALDGGAVIGRKHKAFKVPGHSHQVRGVGGLRRVHKSGVLIACNDDLLRNARVRRAGGGGSRARGRRAAGGGGRAAAAGKARCQQGCRQKAGDQFFHIENSFTSFFFPAPGPTLFLP